MSRQYKVFVDDNYHYSDASERSPAGSYRKLDKALEKCKEIATSSLASFYEKGITAEKLRTQWIMFGDDPFIVGGTGSPPFSARKFITPEICNAVIEACRRKDKRD